MAISWNVVNGKVFFVNEEGRSVTPYLYEKIADFGEEGLMLVIRDGKRGFIDKNAKEVIPCIYDEADFFKNGLAWVCKDEKFGYIDTTGKEIVPLDYYKGGAFSAFNLKWCGSAEDVIKNCDMKAVRDRYMADYAIKRAKTAQEINEIIENYQKTMADLVDSRTARLFEVMKPQEKREVLQKVKQKAKSKIDEVFDEYQEEFGNE